MAKANSTIVVKVDCTCGARLVGYGAQVAELEAKLAELEDRIRAARRLAGLPRTSTATPLREVR